MYLISIIDSYICQLLTYDLKYWLMISIIDLYKSIFHSNIEYYISYLKIRYIKVNYWETYFSRRQFSTTVVIIRISKPIISECTPHKRIFISFTELNCQYCHGELLHSVTALRPWMTGRGGPSHPSRASFSFLPQAIAHKKVVWNASKCLPHFYMFYTVQCCDSYRVKLGYIYYSTCTVGLLPNEGLWQEWFFFGGGLCHPWP